MSISDFRSLVSGGPSPQGPLQGTNVRGRIAYAPKNDGDQLVVTLPDFSMALPFYVPATQWEHAGNLPEEGATCLIVFDERGDAWVPIWDGMIPGTSLPGPAGPSGPQGPAGPGGGVSYTQQIGDGTSKAFTVTHNLGLQGVMVTVFRSTTPFDEVEADIEHTDTNTVTVRTTLTPSTGGYTVVISGPGAGALGSDLSFVYDGTGAPSTTWTVTHNLGKYPSVMVVDTGNTVLEADVHYVNVNQLTVTFAAPTTGKAYLN